MVPLPSMVGTTTHPIVRQLRMKILAFEDNVDIEALLRSSGISIEGHEFVQYWNSHQALDHIQAFKPDILLLDHYLPPITGFQVLETMLASEVQRPSYIIAMSSDETMNSNMVAAGADVGIIKHQLASIWPNLTPRQAIYDP